MSHKKLRVTNNDLDLTARGEGNGKEFLNQPFVDECISYLFFTSKNNK